MDDQCSSKRRTQTRFVPATYRFSPLCSGTLVPADSAGSSHCPLHRTRELGNCCRSTQQQQCPRTSIQHDDFEEPNVACWSNEQECSREYIKLQREGSEEKRAKQVKTTAAVDIDNTEHSQNKRKKQPRMAKPQTHINNLQHNPTQSKREPFPTSGQYLHK